MERRRLNLECKNLKKALLHYIQDAIEEKYIATLIDEYTNPLNNNVVSVIQYLFYNYRNIRSKEVWKKKK